MLPGNCKNHRRLILLAASAVAMLFSSVVPATHAADVLLHRTAGALSIVELTRTSEAPEAVFNEIRTHVCKVRGSLSNGSFSSGSGTYLGDRLVLSAAHVVRDCDQQHIHVSFPNPNSPGAFLEEIDGKVVRVDGIWDQALVELDRFPRHNPPGTKLATDNPKSGDTVTFGGYPGGGSLRWKRGGFVRYLTGGRSSADWFDASTQVIGGYSGGAALNDKGELYGNLWGAGGGTTIAVCTGRTRRFLLPWNARLEAWWFALANGKANNMQFDGYPRYCPPGGCPPYGGGSDGGSLSPIPPEGSPTPPPSGPSMSDALAAFDKKLEDLKKQIENIGKPQPPADEPPKIEPPSASVDYEKIITGVLDAIKTDEAFRGPPGPAGNDGKDGKDCEPQTEPAASRHFVVIGSPEARYAKRLQEEVLKTRTYFDDIRLYPPPEDKNVGTLPALVLYVGNRSAVTYRGTTDVFLQLSRIRQGEFN